MLVLLPPSEGKTVPRRGRSLDVAALSFPELSVHRKAVLAALQEVCAGDPVDAVATLGLRPTQTDEVLHNRRLLDAPTAPAARVYSGVLYEAMDLASLPTSAVRRANRWLVTTSALWGLIRPTDRIPAYRLAGDVALPGIGTASTSWRPLLGEAVPRAAGRGLVLDLRSSAYAPMWRPAPESAVRTVNVRVLHQRDGVRSVVSHFNKATKGRLVRALLLDGTEPRTIDQLAEHLAGLGTWRVEHTPRGGLDIVVHEL